MAAPPPKVFVKAKKRFSKGDDPVFSVFIFREYRDIWNHLFQRDILNRFGVDTKVYTMWGGAAIDQFYRIWASSENSEDTLFNSCLPYPNLDKGYVWRDNEVNDKLHKKVMKRGRKRGRIDCTSLKSKMVVDLCGEAFVAIDVIEKTLAQMLQLCTYEFQFKLKSSLGANDISKTNYGKLAKTNDLIGCLRLFDAVVISANGVTQNDEEAVDQIDDGSASYSESESDSD